MALPMQTPSMSEALAHHYAAHGLPSDGGASNPWFVVRIGWLKVRLPNPPSRRRAVIWHDINHVVTGYNTTFSDGEMSIAAFEVGAGCGRVAIAWLLNLSLFALGLIVRPREVFTAFVRGRHSGSIYHIGRDAVLLAAMSVDEVRALLRVDPGGGLPRFGDRVAFAFWGVVAWLEWLVVPLIIIGRI